MSCCQNSFVPKDNALTNLTVNGRASVCKLCANEVSLGNTTVNGDLILNGILLNEVLNPERFFTLPLSVPAITGVFVGGTTLNLGGSPPYVLNNPGDGLILNNIYAPPVPGLIIRIPMRDFGGVGNIVIDVNVNGSVTTTLLPAVGYTYIDIPLAGVSNPITVTITYTSGSAATGGYDPVIFAL